MKLNVKEIRDLDPGERILMGPGPSGVPPRVLQAMAAPCIGYLDPYFFSVMDETQALLRAVFQTENSLTIPVSGTGLVFLDESGANLAMGRSHAWLPRGTGLIEPRPMNWGENLTMVGAMRIAGGSLSPPGGRR